MLVGKHGTIKFYLFIAFSLMQLAVSFAQTEYGSEKELKKKADGFFDKEEYITCITMYSQLLSIYPKDPEYNFRYGVCNLYAGSEKDKSIAYLSLAAKSEEVDKEVFYYLGKALHLNYRFDEAIANYNIFKTKASAKSLLKLDVNRQIEMCNNGKDLLRNITDLQVVDKNEFPILDYFRAYDLTSIDTRILVKPEDMQTPADKKKNDQSVIIQKNNAQEIYFSSYGENPKGSRDIYKIVKLPNYTFSKPIILDKEINTPYDEEYPYVTPDGKTLYFCSKGHNSMGGYDIFKSEYNVETGKYSTPVNLDFAINTPDDDILYVYDGKGEFAYFSSKRNSGADKITVYKIKNQRIPGTVAMVKGNFYTTDEKTHQAAKITLKNQAGTKIIGAYNVNPKTGDYQFMIRQGETYLYTVESKDFETMSREVKIPVLTELTPVKQKINLKHEGNSDLLTISTEIEAGSTPELIQATMAMLRDRANLTVSSGPSLENETITKNEPKAIVDEVNKNLSSTENKSLVATSEIQSTNSENKPAVTTSPTQIISTENKPTVSASSNISSTENKPKVTTSPTQPNNNENKPTVTTSPTQTISAENKPSIATSEIQTTNSENKPTVSASPTQKIIAENKPTVSASPDKSSTENKPAVTASPTQTSSAENKQTVVTNTSKPVVSDNASTPITQISNSKTSVATNVKLDKQSVLANVFSESKKSEQEAIALDLKVEEEKNKIIEKNDSVKLVDFRTEELTTMTTKLNNPMQLEIARERIDELRDESVWLKKQAAEAAIKVEQYKKEAAQERANAIEEKAFADKLSLAASNNNEAEFERLYYSKFPKQQAISSNDNSINTNSQIPDAEKTNEQLKSDIVNIESKKDILKLDITKTNSPQVKTVINNQITALEKEKVEKENVLAARDAAAAGTTEKSQSTTNANFVDAANYPDEAKILVNTGNNLMLESAQLKKEAETTRKNAATIGKLETKNSELIRASNLDKEARQKEIEAYTGLMQANALLKKSQELLVVTNSNAVVEKKNLPAYITANNLNNQAIDGFKLAENARNSAIKEPNLKLKSERFKDAFETEKLALQQQKKSIETFTQLNPDGLNKTALANANSSSITNATANNSDAISKSQIVANESIKNTNPDEVRKEFEKSDKFPQYTALNNEKKAIDELIIPKKIEIDTLKKTSEKDLATASDLRSYAETLKSKSKKESALNAATVYENNGTKTNIKVAEKQKVVDSLQTVSEAKKNEADVIFSKFENQLNPSVASNINTSEKPIKELDYTQEQLNAIVKKSEYLTYYQTKYNGDSLEFEYQKTFKKVEAFKTEADALLAEKEKYESDSKKERNPTKKIELKKLAKEKDEQSLAKIASADSLYEIAQSFAKKIELADNKLQLVVNRLDNKSAEEFPLIYYALAKKPFDMTKEEYSNTKKSISLNESANPIEIKNIQAPLTQNSPATNDNKTKTDGIAIVNNNSINNSTPSKPNETYNAATATVNSDALNSNKTSIDTGLMKPSTVITAVKQTTSAAPKNNIKPIEGLDYTQDDLDNIRRSTNYQKYYRDKYNGDSLEYVYQKVFKQVETLKAQAEKLYEEKETLIEEAKEELDAKKKQEKRLLAKQKGEEASAKIDEADILYGTAQELAKKIEESDKKLQVVVNALDDKSADEFPLIYNSLAQKPFDKTQEEYNAILATKNQDAKNETPQQINDSNKLEGIAATNKIDNKPAQNTETNTANSLINAKQTVQSNKKDSEIKQTRIQEINGSENFEIQESNAYSTDIPLDVELPKGIIFKVQIGAYKRKVAATAFGGIKPISGETSRTGMIRYSAGAFKNFNSSNEARKKINRAGFNDAYIIAFCNGARIDVNRAKKMVDEGKDCEGNNTNESIALNKSYNSANLSEEMIQILATQKNLKKTEGLLYTVQVGVYKRLISAKRLYNLNDLYYDTLRRGLIRYSHGVFNDKGAAIKAKNKVVEIGIKDAFVIPYFNKRYIPEAEAERLKSSDRNILIKDDLVTKTTTSNTIVGEVISVSKFDVSELKFKVQLGVYRKTVPVEVMSVYLKLAGKGIDELQGNDGTTTYSIGNFNSLEEANAIKLEAQTMGLNDVFVAPYNKGIKISMEQALKMLGK